MKIVNVGAHVGAQAGGDEQLAPVGRPEHERLAGGGWPLVAVKDTAVVIELPATTVPDDGFNDMEKSGAGGGAGQVVSQPKSVCVNAPLIQVCWYL